MDPDVVILGNAQKEGEEDGLVEGKTNIRRNGSPCKMKNVGELNEDENEGKNNRESGGGVGSLQPSPCHSWISNSSSCTNLFGEDDDEEGEGDGGIFVHLYKQVILKLYES